MRMQYSKLKPGPRFGLAFFEHVFQNHPIEIGVRHDAVVLFEIGLGVDAEIDDLLFRKFVDLAQRAAEESRPVANGFFDAERRPPLDHGALVEHAAIVF